MLKSWMIKSLGAALLIAVAGAGIAWKVASHRQSLNEALRANVAQLEKQMELAAQQHENAIAALERLNKKERESYEFDKFSSDQISTDQDGAAAPVLRNTVERLRQRQASRD